MNIPAIIFIILCLSFILFWAIAAIWTWMVLTGDNRIKKLILKTKSRIQRTPLAKHLHDRYAIRVFDRNLKSGMLYEKEISLIERFVKLGDKVFDIGANRGEWSYYLSKAVGVLGDVYAFEPGERASKMLERMKNKYNFSNIHIHKCALADREDFNELTVSHYGRESILKDTEFISGDTETVYSMTIDMIDTDVDFIKCDVDGCELLTLKGGIETLKRCKPVLIVEITDTHTKLFGNTGEDVRLFLKNLGYECYVYENGLIPAHIEYKSGGAVWTGATNNNYVFICDTQ